MRRNISVWPEKRTRGHRGRRRRREGVMRVELEVELELEVDLEKETGVGVDLEDLIEDLAGGRLGDLLPASGDLLHPLVRNSTGIK